MLQKISLSSQVPMELAGQRFDQVAAQLFPEYSRARLQGWIKNGCLTIRSRVVKPNMKVVGGEPVVLLAELEPQGEWAAQEVEFRVLYEDETILVVDKPAGLVVHPAAGNYDGTLLNGLLNHCSSLEAIPRAGIVHRLDKDTTGLMVVAKTLAAQADLVAQMQARAVRRVYVALVVGHCLRSGEVIEPIGRDPKNRKKMAVVASGKPAHTHYSVLKRGVDTSLLEVRLETGRTHQIRVHMAHIGFPLVGDPVYGRPIRQSMVANRDHREQLTAFPRQALHAHKLSLAHPETTEEVSWESPLPEDLSLLISSLGIC